MTFARLPVLAELRRGLIYTHLIIRMIGGMLLDLAVIVLILFLNSPSSHLSFMEPSEYGTSLLYSVRYSRMVAKPCLRLASVVPKRPER